MPTERDITIDETKDHYHRIQLALRLEQGSEAVREQVQERLRSLDGTLSYIIGDRGFEEFVAEKLEEYQTQTDESVTLCSCWRSTCPIKQGTVPAKIRQHGGELTGRREPSELVTEYLQQHDGGEALGLIRKEWGQMVVRTHLELSDCLDALRNSTALPDEDEIKRNLGLDGEESDEDAAGETAGAAVDQPAADD